MDVSNLGRLEGKVDSIAAKLEMLNVSVAGMMPRSEVDTEIAKRVSQEVYLSDQRATNERLIRLESGSTRFLAWAGAGVGCLAVLVSMASVAFIILTYVLVHYKP